MSGSNPAEIKPLTPPSGASAASLPSGAVLPTAPVKYGAAAIRESLFEMTIPYEGGSRFIQMINQPVMKVGRRADNDIVLSERCVSGHHAEFRRLEDGSYEVVDLNSYNGTLVNGERVQRQRIQPGDVVEFGQLRTQIGTSLDPEVTQRLTMTVEHLSQEVDRLQMERNTCHYSLSQLRAEHENSTKVADEERRQQVEILTKLREQQTREKERLESLATERGRIEQEREQLLREAETMRQALLELEEQKARLKGEVASMQGPPSKAASSPSEPAKPISPAGPEEKKLQERTPTTPRASAESEPHLGQATAPVSPAPSVSPPVPAPPLRPVIPRANQATK